MRLQATLSRSIRVSGVGLHSGRHVDLVLHPAPADHGVMFYPIDFPHPIIGQPSITAVVTPENYARHLAPARTFGFLAEYEQLKAHGLARGASLTNCIVVGADSVESGDLRFPDEFVRHKALDL